MTSSELRWMWIELINSIICFLYCHLIFLQLIISKPDCQLHFYDRAERCHKSEQKSRFIEILSNKCWQIFNMKLVNNSKFQIWYQFCIIIPPLSDFSADIKHSSFCAVLVFGRLGAVTRAPCGEESLRGHISSLITYQYKNEVDCYWRSLPRAGLESVMINDGAAALFMYFMRDEFWLGGLGDNPDYCASIHECACQEFWEGCALTSWQGTIKFWPLLCWK